MKQKTKPEEQKKTMYLTKCSLQSKQTTEK